MPQASDIADILGSGDFAKFVGLREGLEFEAKNSTPYDLATAAGMYELAKDVSAFANAAGGYLIIGLNHSRAQDQQTDEVTGLDLVPAAAFVSAQLVGKIKTHVFPTIAGLVVKWVPSRDDATLGLGCVHVPAQSEERKLFIVTRVAEDGVTQTGGIVGVVRRIEASNVPMTGQDVYGMLRSGNSPRNQQLQRIEEKVDALLKKGARAQLHTPEQSAALLKARIKDMLGGAQ